MTAERREAASPDLAGGPEDHSTVSQRTTDLTPGPATGLTLPAPSTPAPAPPAAFGRYQVRGTLGEGGFGAVYLGHDGQLDRPVAIKVLHAGPGLPQNGGELAQQEARRLARLRHPGIVTVHDVGIHEGQVYIVSDYLDGPDLGCWLKDKRPAWPEAVRVVAAVADALAHAHTRLVIHRDVKPANIILTADRTPVLVDFGLALDEVRAGGGEKGVICGTPWYMSPEQTAGTAHRIDGRTDVYSLGVVLYELLTGRVPFQATNAVELLRQVRDDEPQPPRQLVGDLPADLERACLKALAKRQQDRYTTAADFADELRRILPTTADASVSRQMAVETPLKEARTPTLATPRPDTLTPPSSRRRAREAERRQVSVLVCGCDLFESEAYLQLDAEDQAQVLQGFQEACGEAVRRFDGTIVQSSEQGLLVCFGYPVAYEDAARRAARSGLAILEDLKGLGEKYRRQHKLELTPWVGIHTGPAVVEAKEDAVSMVGEARNVAVRLKEVAAAGQVICTEATRRLLQGRLQCASVGHRKIEGVPQRLQLFRVEQLAVAGSLSEASAPAELSPLIGRDHEISLLKDRWEQAQEGMGQVVLLIGEPGLGKSRLVYTLKDHVLGRLIEGEVDAPVIEWRCSPHFLNTGLYPAIDFFERALAFDREEPPQARFDRLVHRLEQYDLARPEAVPLWASLLSLPIPDRFTALSLPPARQREETFRAMLEWLHVRAARRPILFVVEDLHWVDASTLEFLGQFLAEGLHDRILTVLTFRPEFQTPWPALAHQTGLALTRLTRRQVGDLMRKKAGGALPEAVVEQVYERAGGVPLFVEEFTTMVQELGALDQAGEGGTGARAFPEREIPGTLQDLMTARLDRMGGDRELAQIAAVLGREFSYESLAAVAGLDEPTLQTELGTLVRAEILYPKGRPPRCTYIFKHALLEDALYNALVEGKRQHLHEKIARALEAGFPQTVESRPELLAHHFTEAGLPEAAIRYLLRAASRSQERSASVEAIGHLTKGLALLKSLPESPNRDAWELQLLGVLAPAYRATRGYAAAEIGPVLYRARELCERMSDPQQLFAVMWGIWAWHNVLSDFKRVNLANEAMEFARRLNDPGMLMEASLVLGLTKFYRGDFAGVRDCCGKAVAEYDDRKRTKFWAERTGQNAGVTNRCYLSLSLWHLGYPDQALRVNREMVELARAIGHPFTLAHALNYTAWFYLQCRLGAETVAAADEQINIALEQRFVFWRITGMLYKHGAMLLKGQMAEALPLFLEGLDGYRATGATIVLTHHLSILGEAFTKANRLGDARKVLDEALALAEKHDERCHEAELHRLQGELLLAESPNQSAAAEGCFRRAVETARRQQSRGWELRATMSLARFWQRQGRRDEARGALAAVYDSYREGFTMPDLVDAGALVEGLS
jgi:class 3 adenylate cyclase/predicted ATPase